jgi:thiamine pyrophosphokinase
MKMTQSSEFHTTIGINLVGGGTLTAIHVANLQDSDSPTFCADRGLNHARAANLAVSGVIGDLDTVGELPDAPFPVVQDLDQNTTDLEKSLNLLKAKYILCYGFLGGRMDHSLASFNAIAKTKQHAFLIGEEDTCVVCPPHLRLSLPQATRFSLFPMSPSQATSTGLKWNVDGVALTPLGMVSTSNQTQEPEITVNIEQGVVLAIFPNAVLLTVLEQWPF